MLRKILYGVGGVFALLVVIGIFAPAPEPKEVSSNSEEQVVINETHPAEIAVEAETGNDISDAQSPLEPEAQVAQSNTVATVAQPKTEQSQIYYSVTSVVDGDTIKINMNGTVETLRLIGMDTPETVDPRKPVQCFGKEASNKAKELLSGKKVRIESDTTQDTRDVYGRLLVYVYTEDGLFFNKHMIEQGYAHEYTYKIPYKYQSEFKTAQQQARTNNRGLWSPNTCNGDTASAASQSSAPASTATSNASTASGKYYTSSHHSAKLWYPESCDGWKSLSASYLESFSTIESLLAKYPNKTKSPQCN